MMPSAFTLDFIQDGNFVAAISLVGLAQAHAESLIELYTDMRVRQFLGGPVSVHEARKRLDRLISTEEYPAWAVIASEQPIGLICLDAYHDGQETEISYMLKPAYQGQGLAFNAMQQALSLVRQSGKYERLIAETQAANITSIRLLNRLGFELHEDVLRFGAWQHVFRLDMQDGNAIF